MRMTDRRRPEDREDEGGRAEASAREGIRQHPWGIVELAFWFSYKSEGH